MQPACNLCAAYQAPIGKYMDEYYVYLCISCRCSPREKSHFFLACCDKKVAHHWYTAYIFCQIISVAPTSLTYLALRFKVGDAFSISSLRRCNEKKNRKSVSVSLTYTGNHNGKSQKFAQIYLYLALKWQSHNYEYISTRHLILAINTVFIWLIEHIRICDGAWEEWAPSLWW